MKLLTKDLLKRLPRLRETSEKEPEDVKVITKFFDPTGSWSWYPVEYCPEEELFFGYVQGMENELGYFSLKELEEFKGLFHLGIERDLYFKETTLEKLMKGN